MVSEMIIYLMRHGKYVPKDVAPERPLSEEGQHDVKRMAQCLKRYGINVDAILHSGKTRAMETASLMGETLNPGIIPRLEKGLSPMDDVDSIAGLINDCEETLLIVGHLPHLGKLASLLITGNASASIVNFQQGGVLCLQRVEQAGWAISWMLHPELIA